MRARHRGAKIDRIMVLLKNMKNEFYHAIHPNVVAAVRLDKKVVPYELVQKVVAFLCIYALVLLVSTTVITAYGIPIFDAMFMTLSSLGNVGYGYGVTSQGVYIHLPVVLKVLAIII